MYYIVIEKVADVRNGRKGCTEEVFYESRTLRWGDRGCLRCGTSQFLGDSSVQYKI